MNVAEKHIRHFNRLNGNEISKAALQAFHGALKKDIDSKKIDPHMPYGIEAISIEKRLAKAVTEMNGAHRIVEIKKPIALGNPKSLIVTQTDRGPEVKVKKVIQYDREDITMLYGLEQISNDKDLDGKPLDGLNDTTYKVITDRILALIKQGGLIWRKPWNTKVNGPTDLAHNYVTKTLYRAGNYYLNFLNEALGGLVVKIKGEKKTIAYKHSMYFTFNQVTDLGGKVNKDENGWPVIYFKWLYKDLKKNKLVDEKEALDERKKLKPGYLKFPGLFYYTVFNYEQCSDLKIKINKAAKRTVREKIESAEEIIDDMPKRPELKYGGDRAFYSPGNDFVQMPPLEYFKVDQQYYSVFFHELIHSTGSRKRLERDLTGRFGSKNYAFEELIAELGASFLCGQSGILYYTMKNSAAYIQSWSTALTKEMEADPKFFLRAASQAQKAADFILDIKKGEILKVKTTPSSKKPRPPVERTAAMKTKKKRVAKASKSDVDNKNPEPPQETKEVRQADAKPLKEFAGLGFITADKTPENPSDTFTLPGPIGSILGRLQRFKLEIVIPGETHSGKSELGKQIADAFISGGYSVGWVDWEQGGLQSRDTQESIKRNVKPENRKKLLVSAEVPKTLEAVKSLASKFDVVVLDSGNSLKQVTNEWIDELREEFPKTIWVILMQQNTKGGTRGGSAAEYDSPIVLFTYRPDHTDYAKNYAKIFKNRGNPGVVGKYYLIAQKVMVNEDPSIVKTSNQPMQ